MAAHTEEYRVRGADGVEVALHRVRGERPAAGPPLLLVPGTFSTRLFWLGAKAQGFGVALARAGFDPWVLEPRGHGASDRPPSWTIDEWIRLDAPAAVERVLQETGGAGVVWVGHSAGGVVGAAFAGSDDPLAAHLSALVLLGAPGPGGLRGVRRLGARALMLGAAVAPGIRWPGRRIGLGPETEPGHLIRDWMRWNVSGRWRSESGYDYLAGLSSVRVPLLGIAGAGDTLLAPPAAVRDLLQRFGSADRTLIVAGRRQGFSIDYDHPGLVIGRPAREEIWPRIVDWLGSRRTGGPPPEPVSEVP